VIHDIPLLRSLDPHHSRLGYLGVCAAVGVRALDTYDALVARMRDVLFERLYDDQARYHEAVAAADRDLIEGLLDRKTRPEEEDPAAILSPMDARSSWLTRSEAWLADRRMPSHIGYLQKKHVGRTVDFARWVGVLLPTFELSEDGMLLNLLVTGGKEEAWHSTNLLYVRNRPATVLHYLRLLLRSEILFPSLLVELSEREAEDRPVAARGPNGLLRAAIARLQGRIGAPDDPEDMLAVRELGEILEAVLKSLSTEENYLRPRLEMLVDIGLLERPAAEGLRRKEAFPWRLSEEGHAIAAAWKTLETTPQQVDEFLEKQFIAANAALIGRPLRSPKGDTETLLWFARAAEHVQREIGFTPGRTIASLASLYAAEHAVRLEVSEVFRVVYAVPGSPYKEYLRFSGGSRFDAEFMIRVDPGLSERLRADGTHIN
jgi:hypothetical protein